MLDETTQETTGLQRALDLQDVPKEKWTTLVVRTVTGTVFVLVGLFIVITQGLGSLGLFIDLTPPFGTVRAQPQPISLPIFFTGIALIVLGPTTWSTQIVVKSVMALTTPAKVVREIMRGRVTPPGGTSQP